jgi:hypothetical protein
MWYILLLEEQFIPLHILKSAHPSQVTLVPRDEEDHIPGRGAGRVRSLGSTGPSGIPGENEAERG